ncbi:hypothetical protein M2266_006529 [Streptomyces sp. SPB162]|nr:hypothetical protein [Streptomyces sp. SPB162]
MVPREFPRDRAREGHGRGSSAIGVALSCSASLRSRAQTIEDRGRSRYPTNDQHKDGEGAQHALAVDGLIAEPNYADTGDEAAAKPSKAWGHLLSRIRCALEPALTECGTRSAARIGWCLRHDAPGCHPVCRRPTLRGAGVVQGVKVERATVRTTLTPWAATARLCLGRRWTGWQLPPSPRTARGRRPGFRHPRVGAPPPEALPVPGRRAGALLSGSDLGLWVGRDRRAACCLAGRVGFAAARNVAEWPLWCCSMRSRTWWAGDAVVWSAPCPGPVLSPLCGRGRRPARSAGGEDMEARPRRTSSGAAALCAALISLREDCLADPGGPGLWLAAVRGACPAGAWSWRSRSAAVVVLSCWGSLGRVVGSGEGPARAAWRRFGGWVGNDLTRPPLPGSAAGQRAQRALI